MNDAVQTQYELGMFGTGAGCWQSWEWGEGREQQF